MKRVVLFVLSGLAVIVGTSLLASGIWIWSVFGTEGVVRAGAGRIDGGPTATAVVADLVGVSTEVPLANRLGEVSLSAASRDGTPVFLGWGPTAAVDQWLAGHPYAAAKKTGGGRWSLAQVPGTGSPDSPTAQTFWTASGSGLRTTLPARDVADDQTLVVMRADGTAPIAANLVLEFRSSSLFPIAVGLLAAGALLLLGAFGLLVWALRSGRRAAEARALAAAEVAEPAPALAAAVGPAAAAGDPGSARPQPPLVSPVAAPIATEAAAGAAPTTSSSVRVLPPDPRPADAVPSGPAPADPAPAPAGPPAGPAVALPPPEAGGAVALPPPESAGAAPGAVPPPPADSSGGPPAGPPPGAVGDVGPPDD